MLPIVYGRTVGLACQQFSHINRRSRGLFLSYPLKDRLAQILSSRPRREVDVMVVRRRADPRAGRPGRRP